MTRGGASQPSGTFRPRPRGADHGMPDELNLNEDPDVRETGGLPRVDDVGGNADEGEDRLADAFGSLDVTEPDDDRDD